MSLKPNIIAKKYNMQIFNDDDRICEKIGTLENQSKNALCWAKTIENLQKFNSGIVICRSNHLDEIEKSKEVVYLSCNNPRLYFAKIVNSEFSYLLQDNFTNDVLKHRKNRKIRIGENVFIGKNVKIGDGTTIEHSSVIYSDTVIGSNCVIGPLVSIGTSGLGLEKDPDTNVYFSFPQIGGVVIEDYVHIGPSSTVRRSALQNTVIKRGTKLGSLCNIGHNSIIGENCILTGNIIIAGSSTIGNEVFFGIGTTVKNAVQIGDNSTLGQGSVVIHPVPPNEIWVGNPAKKVKK